MKKILTAQRMDRLLPLLAMFVAFLAGVSTGGLMVHALNSGPQLTCSRGRITGVQPVPIEGRVVIAIRGFMWDGQILDTPVFPYVDICTTPPEELDHLTNS